MTPSLITEKCLAYRLERAPIHSAPLPSMQTTERGVCVCVCVCVCVRARVCVHLCFGECESICVLLLPSWVALVLLLHVVFV